MIQLGAQPRILVVALRRLGDVLLTTPLIRSLKRAWPDAAIDALVFRGTEGILAQELFDDDLQSASGPHFERPEACIAFHQVAERRCRVESERGRDVLECATLGFEQIRNDHQSHPVEQRTGGRQAVRPALLDHPLRHVDKTRIDMKDL